MKTPAFILAAVLATVALAGCSAGSLPGLSSAPAGNTAAPGASGAPSSAPTKPAGSASGSGKQVDVCSVVNLAKVNSITGRTYATATPANTATKSRCNYDGADSTTLEFALGVFYDGGSATFTQLISDFGLGDPAKPIFDIGDQAVDVNDAVIAQYGTDDLFAVDEVHPGSMSELPQSAYVKLIQTLHAAR